jgi:hypothetical protein
LLVHIFVFKIESLHKILVYLFSSGIKIQICSIELVSNWYWHCQVINNMDQRLTRGFLYILSTRNNMLLAYSRNEVYSAWICRVEQVLSRINFNAIWGSLKSKYETDIPFQLSLVTYLRQWFIAWNYTIVRIYWRENKLSYR